MADTYSLTSNPDGSALLHVDFDTTGIQCLPSLAVNDTDFPLPAQTDGNGNIVPWTVETALAAQAAQIAASRAAFLAAAPSWTGPTPPPPPSD